LPASPIPDKIPRGYSQLFEIENRFLNVLPQPIFEDRGDLQSIESLYKKKLANSQEQFNNIYEDFVKNHDDKIKGKVFAEEIIRGKKCQLYFKAINELSSEVQQQVVISNINPANRLPLNEFDSLHHEIKNIWLEFDCRIEKLFGSETKTEYKSHAFCDYKSQSNPTKRKFRPPKKGQVYVDDIDLKHLAGDVENGIITCRAYMKLLINKEDISLREDHAKIELSLNSCIERLKILVIELSTIRFIIPKPKEEHILYDMFYYDLPLKLKLAKDMLLTIFKETDQPVSMVESTINFWKSDVPFKLIEKMHSDYERMLGQSESLTVLNRVVEKHIFDLENLTKLEQIKKNDEKSEKQLAQTKEEKEVISNIEAQNGISSTIDNNIERDNTFVSIGSGYMIKFQGSAEYPFKNLSGLNYIRYCLTNKGRSISADELILLGRDEINDGLNKYITNDESIKKALEDYRKRLHKLNAERQIAEEAADDIKLEKINNESDQISKEISRLTNRHGKIRPETDQTDSFRLSITRAIKYSIKIIKGDMPDLAEHLKKNLQTGRFFYYDSDIDWQL